MRSSNQAALVFIVLVGEALWRWDGVVARYIHVQMYMYVHAGHTHALGV